MWTHRTLRGRAISVDDLTPNEQRLYVHLLELAGGPTLLGEAPRSEAPLDPDAFRTACDVALRRELSDAERGRVRYGFLGLVLEDISERLEVVVGMAASDTVFDPAQLLKRAQRERGETLLALATKTGIEHSHLSKILRGQAGISVGSLQEAARRLDFAFDFANRALAPENNEFPSCSEIAARNLGQRLLALVGPQDTSGRDADLILECRARGLDEGAALEAVRTARETRRLFGVCGCALVETFRVTPQHAADLAWLFLAVELRWFQVRGLCVTLTQEADKPNASEHLSIPAIQEEAVQPAAASQLYSDLIYHPLLRPYRPEQLQRSDENLAYSTRLIRRAAKRLLECEALLPKVRDAVGRWHRALGWPAPNLQAIKASFAMPMDLLRVRRQGSSDVVQHSSSRYPLGGVIPALPHLVHGNQRATA